MRSPRWVEVAERVFVRRHPELLLNCGLVVGDDACAVVDTRAGLDLGRDLAESVREVTPLPWHVVNTHAHYDHCLGNAAFLPCPIHAQAGLPAALAAWAAHGRAATVAEIRALGDEDLAVRVETAEVVPPDHLVDRRATLDLGGRLVQFLHAGPGHTDHDLVVAVPDAGVVFWGDLVEEGADPDFADSFPLTWGEAVSRLLETVEVGLARVMIPGHGSSMTREAVEEQCVALIQLADLLTRARPNAADLDDLAGALVGSGFGEDARVAAAAAVLA